jgi:ribosomal protein S27E
VAEELHGMRKLQVECLGCGAERSVAADPHERVRGGECPRCGYVGWAPTTALTEATRRTFRERPPERRIHVHAA